MDVVERVRARVDSVAEQERRHSEAPLDVPAPIMSDMDLVWETLLELLERRHPLVCERCEGEGTVNPWTGAAKGPTTERPSCPDCAGSGWEKPGERI